MSVTPIQDQQTQGMFVGSATQGGGASYSKRSAQMLSQSRLISDGTAHHFILCSPSEAVDMSAVHRQCSASSPKGAEEVILYHAPALGGGSRRLVAVTVPVSLAPSSVIAMELLKKRLFVWEDELNASFHGMDEDEPPADHADVPSARHVAAPAVSGASAAHSSSQQHLPPASGGSEDAAPCSVSTSGSLRTQPDAGVAHAPPQAGGAPQSQAASGGQRPTLFNLLEVLASDSVTTPEQRNSIRGIVTDFLNHDLPHSKVYSFIGAVVGHDVLHTIVRKLENEPGRLGVPDAGGLARIEKAFGLSKTTNAQSPHSPQPSGVLLSGRSRLFSLRHYVV